MMQDPDDPKDRGGPVFVDREAEADALRSALEQHRQRVDEDSVGTAVLRNILTFYGEGGFGKTELSRQLAAWIGGDTIGTQHWGPPPPIAVSATVRWDANDSRGGIDPLELLIALRTQLGRIERVWSPFDLAFAALFRALRPGKQLLLRAPNAGQTTLSDVLSGLLGDGVSAVGVAVSGGVAAGVFGAGRTVLQSARSHVRGRRLLRAYPGLEQLVADCEAATGEVEETARLAGRVAFYLTLEIEHMTPTKRPLIVTFVDHMERLQVVGERHLGEATLNRLVARLPYVLFVITGRNRLDWHETSADLPATGPQTWPLLSTDDPPQDHPRQHLIRTLSLTDAIGFLEVSFERAGIAVDNALLTHLAEATDGWPLHLQTLVEVARERSAAGLPLTADGLDGPLPSLVNRLLSDLPPDVADAFRAASLLPYFDIEFVAAASGGHIGAVERLMRRHLVRPNVASPYPYRIHDTLRSLVRSAGSAADRGWGEADWMRHAELALAEGQRRFNEAMNAADDTGAILALALGLNVATENNVFAPWLVDGIRRSPSIRSLAPLISAHADAGLSPDMRDVLSFLRLRARADADDVTDALGTIAGHRTAISSSAGLWRSYDLRSRGRTDEALAQLNELLEVFNDRPELYRNQIVTTLRLCRRYRDALELLPELTDEQQSAHIASIDRRHGKYLGSIPLFEHRVMTATSRRYQVEQLGELLRVRHRELGVTEDEVRHAYDIAVEIGHRGAQASCLGVLAQLKLFDDDGFEECLEALDELSSRRFQPFHALPEALALRAWALEDDALAVTAFDIARRASFRSASWCQTEILLEHLGHPLSPIQSQWLEPYDKVQERWLALLQTLVQRARPA